MARNNQRSKRQRHEIAASTWRRQSKAASNKQTMRDAWHRRNGAYISNGDGSQHQTQIMKGVNGGVASTAKIINSGVSVVTKAAYQNEM